MKFIEARITGKKELSNSIFIFEFDQDFDYEAGQFVMVHSPLVPSVIPRPFSILSSEGGLSILLRVYGAWTEKFSRLEKGAPVNLLGPCGCGFLSKLKVLMSGSKPSSILYVAGGVGISSIFSLFKHFSNRDNTLILGGKTEKELILIDKISSLGVKVLVSTEDGTAGTMGRVTDVLQKLDIERYDVIFSCGPIPMMKAVVDFVKSRSKDKPVLVAVEERMACGTGLCFSCAVKTKSGIKLCCKDGPVFYGDELIW